MTDATDIALRITVFQLLTEATRAERNAEQLHEEAATYETRARGLREAAGLVRQALAEEAS